MGEGRGRTFKPRVPGAAALAWDAAPTVRRRCESGEPATAIVGAAVALSLVRWPGRRALCIPDHGPSFAMGRHRYVPADGGDVAGFAEKPDDSGAVGRRVDVAASRRAEGSRSRRAAQDDESADRSSPRS